MKLTDAQKSTLLNALGVAAGRFSDNAKELRSGPAALRPVRMPHLRLVQRLGGPMSALGFRFTISSPQVERMTIEKRTAKYDVAVRLKAAMQLLGFRDVRIFAVGQWANASSGRTSWFKTWDLLVVKQVASRRFRFKGHSGVEVYRPARNATFNVTGEMPQGVA